MSAFWLLLQISPRCSMKIKSDDSMGQLILFGVCECLQPVNKFGVIKEDRAHVQSVFNKKMLHGGQQLIKR